MGDDSLSDYTQYMNNIKKKKYIKKYVKKSKIYIYSWTYKGKIFYKDQPPPIK